MRILFDEQDVIDAVCVYTSEYERIAPEHVRVELFCNERDGIFAVPEDGRSGHRFRQLQEQHVIDAVAVYLRDYHRFDPSRLGIELFFDERDGFSAVIDLR